MSPPVVDLRRISPADPNRHKIKLYGTTRFSQLSWLMARRSYTQEYRLFRDHAMKRCSRRGETKHVAAFYRDRNPARRIPYSSKCRDCEDIRNRYNTYRQGARRRGHEFDLERPTFERLIRSACSYCGTAPRSASRLDIGGIDRVDNDQGYHAANCVPCCFTCNAAKRAMPPEHWRTWLRAIVATAERRESSPGARVPRHGAAPGAGATPEPRLPVVPSTGSPALFTLRGS